MSGSRSQYGLAQQGMLPYGEWVHQDGRPTTAFFSFVRTLWTLAGGSNTPVNPSSGTSGISALAEDVTALESQVEGLQGLLFGLGEVADVPQESEVDFSFAYWDATEDSPNAPVLSASVSFKAGGLIGGDTFFTAFGPCRIVAVSGRLNVANAGAATLTPVLVSSGTAVGSGTAISSAMNLAGTANTVQSLSLTSATRMAGGDSLGLLGSGAIVAATGSLTVFWVEI